MLCRVVVSSLVTLASAPNAMSCACCESSLPVLLMCVCVFVWDAAHAEAVSTHALPFCAPLVQLYLQRVNDLAHFSKFLKDVGKSIQMVCWAAHLLAPCR